MNRKDVLRHEFVEFVPDVLEEGVLYVSITYSTTSHKCCCGCGGEVVAPLSPTDWFISFDGVSVSLSPSIGSWGFKCQSHYWIKNNCIVWADKWSKKKINLGRIMDGLNKKEFYDQPAKQKSKMNSKIKP